MSKKLVEFISDYKFSKLKKIVDTVQIATGVGVILFGVTALVFTSMGHPYYGFLCVGLIGIGMIGKLVIESIIENKRIFDKNSISEYLEQLDYSSEEIETILEEMKHI